MPEGFPKVTTSIVLLGLVAVWGTYLAVWWRDNRAGFSRQSDMIGSFHRGLDTLGNTAGLEPRPALGSSGLLPRSVGEAAQRRRLVITCLGSLAVTTLLLSFIVGAAALLANVMVDAALVWYCYAVVQRRNVEAEREMKVTMLHAGRGDASNVIDLRATVNA